MIFLCGIPSEPPVAMVIDRLQTLGERFVIFNQREFAISRLQWTVSGGCIEGELTVGRETYSLADFSGIYIRLMDDRLLPELDDEPDDSPLVAYSRRFHQALIEWIDIAPGRIVNRFRDMGSNGSKPFQAQSIRQGGFRIPETLITNQPDLVRAFANQHSRIVYKSISGVRSIVTEMSEPDWNRIDDIRACPVQFQAYVPGYDVRVHTIGDEVFATRIDSPGTDYRYAGHDEGGTNLEPIEISTDLSERCINLARELNLPFAGIDLRITPEGDTVCFEVNPSPAYSYYEGHTGQPISLALAKYLAGKGR